MTAVSGERSATRSKVLRVVSASLSGRGSPAQTRYFSGHNPSTVFSSVHFGLGFGFAAMH